MVYVWRFNPISLALIISHSEREGLERDIGDQLIKPLRLQQIVETRSRGDNLRDITVIYLLMEKINYS